MRARAAVVVLLAAAGAASAGAAAPGAIHSALALSARGASAAPTAAAAFYDLARNASQPLELRISLYRLAMSLHAWAPDADGEDPVTELFWLLHGASRHQEAAEVFQEAIQRDRAWADAHGVFNVLRSLLQVCNFTRYDELVRQLNTVIPFQPGALRCEAQYASLDPDKYLLVARYESERILDEVAHMAAGLPALDPPRDPQARIRIGYLSGAGFVDVESNLLRDVFGLHDRARFEVWCYHIGPAAHLARTQLVQIADECEHFVHLAEEGQATNGALAAAIRRDRLHVLMDMAGRTCSENRKEGIVALRVAPIQISMIGHSSTMGAPYIDYIVTDRFVSPPALQDNYSEKFLWMPHSYLGNGMEKSTEFLRIHEAPEMSCSDFHLPDRSDPNRPFVLACAVRVTKLDPHLVSTWFDIMVEVPNSILWITLYVDSPCRLNLAHQARQRGIDPDRIVFTGILVWRKHLKRMACADVFLDTLRFNGHSTSLSILYAGVPLVTLPGEHFHQRVAGSLLRAVGADHLIAGSLDEYRDLVLRLARDPVFYRATRDQIERNQDAHPLFDLDRWVQDLEARVAEVVDLWRRGAAFEKMSDDDE